MQNQQFVLMPMGEEQTKEINDFIQAYNVPCQDGETHYIRRRFQEKRKELEDEMIRVMKKYRVRFMKEVGKVPVKCELIIQPHRFVLIIQDSKNGKMDLKENGELQLLKAIWMHNVKKFVSYCRSKGINDERTYINLNL